MTRYYLRYILAFSCLLFWLLSDIVAQEVEIVPLEKNVIRLSFWKESNGLPTWHINEIIKDSRGLVWLGTEIGLYSMDGARFNSHTITALKNKTPYIKRIIQDAHQNLWLFCETSKGVFEIVIYNPTQAESYTLKAYTGSEMSFSVYATNNMYEKDGNIYILDNYNGISGYFGSDKRWHETGRFIEDKLLSKDVVIYNSQLYWALNLRESKLILQNAEGVPIRTFETPQKVKLLDYRIGRDGLLYVHCLKSGEHHLRPRLFRCDSLDGFVPVSESEKYSLTWQKLSFNGFRLPPVWANNAMGVNINKKFNRSIDVFDGEKLIYSGLEQVFKKKDIEDTEFRITTLPDGSFWMVGLNTLIRIEVTRSYFSTLFHDMEKKPSTRGVVRVEDNLYVNSYSGLLIYDLKNQKTRLFDDLRGRGLLKHGRKIWGGLHSAEAFSIEQNKIKNYPFKAPKFAGEPDEVYIAPNEGVYVGVVFQNC